LEQGGQEVRLAPLQVNKEEAEILLSGIRSLQNADEAEGTANDERSILLRTMSLVLEEALASLETAE
jgi:hypothetical protein